MEGSSMRDCMMEITDESVEDEQGGFLKDNRCVDQIFAARILVEKYVHGWIYKRN